MSPDEMPDQPRSTPHPGPDRIQAIVTARHREPLAGLLVREPVWARTYEWRRLFSELFGTFLLVLVGSGAPVLDAATHGQIGRVADLTAPALMVLAIILFMGAVSGGHLNPIVSIAFALRGDFGWLGVPGYLVAQLAGALLASRVLRLTFGDWPSWGRPCPEAGSAPPRPSSSKRSSVSG
jgi:aquaporin Z